MEFEALDAAKSGDFVEQGTNWHKERKPDEN